MKKVKYGIFCCLIFVGVALVLVLTNSDNSNTNATSSVININCAREITMPNNTNMELNSNAVSFGTYNLFDFSVTIVPKSQNNSGGLIYHNGVFSSNLVGSYTVTFSKEYEGKIYRDSIVINVIESDIETEYVLYLDSPQLIVDMFQIDSVTQLDFIVDDEYIQIENGSLIGVEEGLTHIKLLKQYQYYDIYKELDVQVVANHINYENVYDYRFEFKEGEVYSLQFKLYSNISLTNQDLISIDYDNTLIEVINFDSPLIHISPKSKCTTTITLTFETLDEPIEFNLEFI